MMSMMSGIGSSLLRLIGRGPKEILKRDLPRSAVTHDSLDDLALGNMLEESPRFRAMTVEQPPHVPPAIQMPDPIDITTATPEEVAEYQEAAREARQAKEEAPEYRGWKELTADVYRSLHTHDTPEVIEEVDPDVALHPRILGKLLSQEEHAEARNISRDDEIAAGLATMSMMDGLREVVEEHLGEQAREQEEVREQREQAQEHQQTIEELRDEARALHDAGQPIPPELAQQMREEVKARQEAAQAASQIAENPTPMGSDVLDAIAEVAKAGRDAAEAAGAVPRFGAGMGAGEPVYTSPEQALSIAEQWANNPDLREMAELFGRMDRDIRFKRSKRVVGGNEEIVDIKFGANLNRTLPSELALLADPDFEDDFFARYSSEELLEFSTVGEENAGRGPILIVLDGSGSMQGERNIWSRAVAMCLLHISRLEKRDFALVEFSSGGQIAEWFFKASDPMMGDKVLDMASHLFSGGTTPIIGVDRAVQIMREAPAFSKADVVLVGDGDAGFGAEDERLRDQLREMGVRIFGIGIGGSFDYIERYCQPDGFVVDVRDFDLKDPSAATAELATHIT